MDLEECVKLGRELESRLADVNRLEQLKLSLEGMVEVVSHMRDEESSILSLAAASHGKEDLAIMISAAKRIVLNRNIDTLKRAIDESVASQDEVTLPGLGVFLEIIWENADQELKNQLVDIIKKRVEKGIENEKKEN